ncbi:hypothetical protein H6F46_02465 [Limnothrix sp. FACHB-1083]|uniref:hypothetical protein n=1 Tax=unclassified Limnothrix TaxID=2632864 RepID=UPI001680D634|nr:MULTISPECIES: hypothetical protein [unclassified Limnothrix]MBD2159551.1 hypothetical protein [Limnothrix sp. FACHB-1083]MBD2190253.1 hypothetical protein [Limnothrix sp. FACHB-1088]
MYDFIDPTHPFLTTFRDDSDYNQSDELNEMERLFERHRLIDKVVAGTTPVDDLLDCLNDQEYDVDQYIDTVCDDIEFHIANDFGRLVDPSDLEFFQALR